MNNYKNYKLIKYGHYLLKYYFIFTLFAFILSALSGYTSENIGLIFVPVILLYFYLNKIDSSKIGNFEIMLNNNEPFFEPQAHPGTTMMGMLKQQDITCEDIRSIQFMACSLQHWSKYYQEELIGQGYQLDKVERIEVYAFDSKTKVLAANNNVHFYPTKKILTRHTNLIHLKDGKMFICYEPEHIVINGEDRLKYGSFLFEIQPKNYDQVEKSFSIEVVNMQEAA
ncbi:hypothetical protein SPONL_450 [uncultured Candidatus Thioglobus sp.]|nr:hypothetical protein SPONL_450 [uncultured Candidatus Thioglobus sp.]